jgi:hypothetical protein
MNGFAALLFKTAPQSFRYKDMVSKLQSNLVFSAILTIFSKIRTKWQATLRSPFIYEHFYVRNH